MGLDQQPGNLFPPCSAIPVGMDGGQMLRLCCCGDLEQSAEYRADLSEPKHAGACAGLRVMED